MWLRSRSRLTRIFRNFLVEAIRPCGNGSAGAKLRGPSPKRSTSMSLLAGFIRSPMMVMVEAGEVILIVDGWRGEMTFETSRCLFARRLNSLRNFGRTAVSSMQNLK
ncbi:hypothetical protein X948_4251 [Burkholderia pseudomallei MSHR5608]|nr:hypothetical protein X948_4251 [Burkholderia pseudomallei MSHR5608]